MNRKLKRTLPFLHLLRRVADGKKHKMLKSCPVYVVDDIVEILYNILHGNTPIRNAKYRRILFKKKTALSKIVTFANNRVIRHSNY